MQVNQSKLPFAPFIEAVNTQWALMQTAGILVRVDVDPNVLWDHYMASFPEGTNIKLRERREYECTHCMGFIRKVGNVVAITPNGIKSIWDVTVNGYHQVVADAMAALVKAAPINNYYLDIYTHVGVKASNDFHEAGLVWKHFYVQVPKDNVVREDKLASTLGEMRTTAEVFERGLKLFSLDAAETVLELINQNSLYKGIEYKNAVEFFVSFKKQFDLLQTDDARNLFIWATAKKQGMACRFRGSVIGTLVEDISSGKELEIAVKSFETKVAPENYKRPTALITTRMVEEANKTLIDLGFEEAIYRRFAVPTDLTVNNVLFSATVKKAMNAMDGLLADTKSIPNPKALEKIEEVSVEKFLKDILPGVKSLEILFQNKLSSNLVTLIAPLHTKAPNMFKWDNNFSWAYTGDITDSLLRSKVQALGGRVDGVLRFSHTWNYDPLNPNQSLMDLHVFMPGWKSGAKVVAEGEDEIHDNYGSGRRVGWNHRNDHASGGKQDVDYVNPPGKDVPVENTTFPSMDKLPEGEYLFKIHNWDLRPTTKNGFKAEIECGGTIYSYEYPKALKNKQWITVAKAVLKDGQFTMTHMLPESSSSKPLWNVNTETFVPVTMVMNSPNHWDGQAVGNKHLFFIMDQCKNPDSARGFFNEFLGDELVKHRKVFEVLGAKTKAEPTDVQISGLGFSETKRESVTVRVTGKVVRTFVIKF